MAGFEREQNKVVFFLNYWELLNGLMDVFTMIFSEKCLHEIVFADPINC